MVSEGRKSSKDSSGDNHSSGHKPPKPPVKQIESKQNDNTKKIVEDAIEKIIRPGKKLNIVEKLLVRGVKYDNIREIYNNITKSIELSKPLDDDVKLLILQSIIVNIQDLTSDVKKQEELNVMLMKIEDEIGKENPNPAVNDIIVEKVTKMINQYKLIVNHC